VTHDDTINAYCAAWNEPDPQRRAHILGAVWSEGAIYADATVQVRGNGALIAHMGKVLARTPGSRVVRTGALDMRCGIARFRWTKVLADGTRLPEGLGFAEFAPDGTLKRVVGLFGPRMQRA